MRKLPGLQYLAGVLDEVVRRLACVRANDSGGQYLATPPLTGPYQGLALFADRGNTAPLRFTGSGASSFTGTIYARQAPMELTSGDVAVQLDSLIVVRTLKVTNSAEILLSFVPEDNAVTSSWGANLTK